MKPVRTPFGERLRHMRFENRDQTLTEMAKAINVTAPHLSQIETGKRGAPAHLIKSIKAAYGLSKEEAHELTKLAAKSTTNFSINTKDPQLKMILRLIGDHKDKLKPEHKNMLVSLLTNYADL